MDAPFPLRYTRNLISHGEFSAPHVNMILILKG